MVGTVAGHKTLLLCGRVHGYEGYAASEVGFGVRVAAALGVQTLIVTNAAGGIDPTLTPGEIVAIADQLNLTGTSALCGPNDERLGPRFVDMTDAYSPALRALAALAAPAALGRPLREAVYAGVAGPAYETPAEVRMLRALGAGLVGMSTVHEVTAARHAGLAVLGLSLVSNHAAGVKNEPLAPRGRHARRRRRLRRAGIADRGGDRVAAAAEPHEPRCARPAAAHARARCSRRRAPCARTRTRPTRASPSAPPCSTTPAASTPAATSRTRRTA